MLASFVYIKILDFLVVWWVFEARLKAGFKGLELRKTGLSGTGVRVIIRVKVSFLFIVNSV